MPEQQTKWSTPDGQEFESEEAARRHEELQEAQEALEAATLKWTSAVARHQKTADGYDFEWSHHPGYWWVVVDPWNRFPEARRVDGPWLHHAKIDERDHALVVEERFTAHTGERRRIEIRITELYRDERNAQRAALEAQRKTLEQLIEQHNALAGEMGGNGVSLVEDADPAAAESEAAT